MAVVLHSTKDCIIIIIIMSGSWSEWAMNSVFVVLLEAARGRRSLGHGPACQECTPEPFPFPSTVVESCSQVLQGVCEGE